MKLLESMILVLQLTNILAKKRHKSFSSSEESIENILYYKDCNHKPKDTKPMKLNARVPPPPMQQECKMCCTMCCGDDCQSDCDNRQAAARQPMINSLSGTKTMPRQPDTPIQPPIRVKKKKLNQPLLPPIGRRDFGFTRENIKTLIAQDDDIKKILKDLVKVTMQKADLVQMINGRRNEVDQSDYLVDSDNDEEL